MKVVPEIGSTRRGYEQNEENGQGRYSPLSIPIRSIGVFFWMAGLCWKI